MNVEDAMTRDPLILTEDTDLDRAMELMDERAFRHLPVVRGERLVGIVSNRDLLEATGWVPAGARAGGVDPLPRTVGQVMRSPVFTVEPKETVVSAALELGLRGIGALPVVAGDRLVGILTERDLLRVWLEACQRETVPGETDAPIARVITRGPRTLSPRATLAEAVVLCRSGRVRHLPVVEGHELVGFLSDRDLKRALGQHRAADTPLIALLAPEVVTLTEDLTLHEAARLMYERGFSGIPITSGTAEDPGRALVGLVTLSDVLAYCMETLREPDRP